MTYTPLATTGETMQRLLDEAMPDGLKGAEIPMALSTQMHKEHVQNYRVHIDGVVEQFSEDVKAWLKTLTN